MGTRSLTFVYDGEEPVLCMYKQYDGYPSGLGRQLLDFLAPFVIVNGYGSNASKTIANGMGCLAAQLVCNFKDGVGSVYLYPTDITDCGQEYEYHIYEKSEKLYIKVYDGVSNLGVEPVFDGAITEDDFGLWIKQGDDE